MEARLDARFAAADARFEAMEARFDARFESMEARFDARFESMEARFDARFETIDARFDASEARFGESLERAMREQTNRFLVYLGVVVTLVTAAGEVIGRAVGA